MTSRLVQSSSPLVSQVARRQFAAQASQAKQSLPTVSGAKLPEAKLSSHESGVSVISADSPSALATVGIVVRTGPRFETYDNQGVSHALRIAGGLGTKRFSQFSVVRSMQQAGGPLQVVLGREHILYATQLHKDKIDDAVDYLFEVAGGQVFKPWEINDNTKRFKVELDAMEPGIRVNELLHKAAYREGLGYSLYSPEFMVGKHKPTTLQSFYNKTFTSRRTAVVGIGVDHQRLNSYAGMLSLESGEGPSSVASKYYGGEIRTEAAGNMAIISLAAEAAGGNNLKEAIAAMILQRVWGCGVHVKWGSGAGKLQKAAAEAVGSSTSSMSGPPKVSAFNFVYSDSGLVGAQISASAEDAGKVVSAVAAAIRSSSVTAEELAAAKRCLLNDAYGIILESALSRAEDLGLQALIKKEIIPLAKVPEVIDSIQLGDVQAVAKKVSSSKLSLGAYGNLSTVPYLDSL